MDPLDVRIVRAMGIRPYGRVPKGPDALRASRIARALGTTVDTVKDRLARMEQTGVIAGYQVVPNLRHMGLAASAFYFRAQGADEKEKAVRELQSLSGLLEVHDFLGGGLCVEFAYPGVEDRDRRLERLCSVTGDMQPAPFHDWEMPPVSRSLTNLDWRILRELRGRARRPLGEVAEALGVSVRTVKRHHDRMATEGSFVAFPLLDPSQVEGLILFVLLVYLEHPTTPEDVRRVLGPFTDRCIQSDVPASGELGHVDMMLVARNPREVETLRQEAAGLPGVARADAWLFRGVVDNTGWVDDLIEERVRAAKTPSRPGLSKSTRHAPDNA